MKTVMVAIKNDDAKDSLASPQSEHHMENNSKSCSRNRNQRYGIIYRYYKARSNTDDRLTQSDQKP